MHFFNYSSLKKKIIKQFCNMYIHENVVDDKKETVSKNHQNLESDKYSP